ncbi:MAG: hypothetical protein WC325_08675, partial [Candidatus Bathyarchaeia archaeon]
PATYTITASAGTGGSISPSGAVVVTEGDDQTFNIAASTGYHIADVVVDTVSQGAITTYTFNDVAANHEISATFAIDTFTITATAGTGGTITPSGAVSVNYGDDQGFDIAASTGYHIVGVVVDTVSQGAITTYTFNDVAANHEISATFEEDAPVPETLFSDDFESGSFGSNWVSTSWWASSIDSSQHHSGIQSARLTTYSDCYGGENGYITLQISTTGYSSIELSYWRMFDKSGGGSDYFIVEWRVGTSGGGWSTIDTLSSDLAWAQNSLTLSSSADNKSAIQIRFKVDQCDTRDFAWVDDVVIIGTPLP